MIDNQTLSPGRGVRWLQVERQQGGIGLTSNRPLFEYPIHVSKICVTRQRFLDIVVGKNSHALHGSVVATLGAIITRKFDLHGDRCGIGVLRHAIPLLPFDVVVKLGNFSPQ